MTDADLHRDIETTREALGDTVEALVRKTDVKARVGEKVDERKAQLRRSVDDVRPGPVIALVVAAALVVVALVRRRRR